ncbi:MAG: TIGR01777 family oxidoreductase [Gammaproteobacteria bacterium]|nr:TIGR01777 family oxidoreductase [Gammaproteobacteria bacterium]
MNILITGATGFLGRALCTQLHAQNHILWVYTRNTAKARQLLGEKAKHFVSRFDEIPDDASIDAIVNLAGEPILFKRWTKKRKQQLENSRIGVTDQLLALIRRLDKKPELLISGSAVGYYGNRGDRKLTEASHGEEDFGHRLCAAWESRAIMARAYGVRVCIVRTGVVLDKDGGMLQGLLPPFKLGLGGRIGNGRQWMSWIHLEDWIGIVMMLIARRDLDGIFNATAPLPVTNAYFTAMLAKLLHRPAFFHIPAPVLRLLLGENAEVLLGGQRVFPKAISDAGYEFRFGDLRGALGAAISSCNSASE